MSQVHASGRSCRIIYNADDMTTALTGTIIDNATQETVTLGTNDVVIPYLVSIRNGATEITLTLFDDADGDGALDAAELIFEKIFAANEHAGFALVRGFPLKRVPKLKGSASSAGLNATIFCDIQE